MAAKINRKRVGAVYRKAPIDYILRPFRLFAENSSAGGILLAFCVIVARFWANSAWSDKYFALWQENAALQVGAFQLEKTLKHWIDDGLMAIFFFVVGLEIKREMLAGELADLRKAMFPLMAAIGGMIAPALVYLLLVSEPLLQPVRRVVPLLGGIDLSPLVLLVLLQVLSIMLGHLQASVMMGQ